MPATQVESAGLGSRSWVSSAPLLLVLFLSALLRLYGLTWHLPIVRHPDESRLIYMTLSLGTGKLTPPELIYGSLMPYVLAFLYGLFFVFLRVTGQVNSLSHFAVLYCLDETPFYLLGRALSVACDLVSVYVLYKAVRNLLPDSPAAALLAALALAVYPLAVARAHNALPDSMLALMSALTLLMLSHVAREPHQLRLHLLAGLFAGLAVATKVLGGGLLLAYLLVCFWYRRQGQGIRVAHVFAALLAFSVSLLVAEPSLVVDRATFARDVIQFQMANVEQGQGEARWALGQVLNAVLGGIHTVDRGGLGMIGALLLLLGTVYLFASRDLRPRLTPFALWAALYLAWLAIQGRHQHNWIMPALPFLCLVVGLGASVVLQATTLPKARSACRGLVPFLAVIVCVAAFIPPALTCVNNDFRRTLPDTRVLATERIYSLLPSGALLLLDGSTWTLPRILESQQQLDEWLKRISLEGRWASLSTYLNYKKKAIALWKGPTYRVIRLKHPWWGPGEAEAEALSDVAPKPPIYDYEIAPIRAYQKRGVQYVITTDDAITRFDRPEFPSSAEFYKDLRSEGRLVVTIAPDGWVQGPAIYLWDIRAAVSSGS